MASGRKRVRYTLDIHFRDGAEKDAFVKRLGTVRSLLSSGNASSVDNFGLMSAMFDIVEGVVFKHGKRVPNCPVFHEE